MKLAFKMMETPASWASFKPGHSIGEPLARDIQTDNREESVGPSSPVRSIRVYLIRYLWIIALTYVGALLAFVAYELLSLSALGAILGTLVFTALATLLASLAFSKDMERFSQGQSEAYAQISRGDREVMMEQVRILRDQLVELKSTRMAQERQREAQRMFEVVRGDVPKVMVRIGEKQAFVLFIPVMDFWLRVTTETPLVRMQIVARTRNVARNLFGAWIRYQRAGAKAGATYDVIKFGGIGVRGVHDEAEVHAEVVTKDGARFIGEVTLTLAASNSAYIPFQRA